MSIDASATRFRRQLGRVAVTTGIALLLVGLLPLPAWASFPGNNGKIAFVSNRSGDYDIYSMNSDGSGVTNLTGTQGIDFQPSWSKDGSKIVFLSLRDGNYEIYSMNADGSAQTRLTNNAFTDVLPSWSPDGSRVAFASFRSGNLDVYLMNSDGSGESRVTSDPAIDSAPVWSPDGSKLAFMSTRGGAQEIFVMNIDGSGATQVTSGGSPAIPDWSPDGSRLAFESGGDIEVVNSDGTGRFEVVGSPGTESAPAWSPDGSRITYSSDLAGEMDIYTVNVDGSSSSNLTSDTGSHSVQADWQSVLSVADAAAFVSAPGPAASRAGSKRFRVTVVNEGPVAITTASVAAYVQVNGSRAPGSVSAMHSTEATTLAPGESKDFMFEWSYPKESFARGAAIVYFGTVAIEGGEADTSDNTGSVSGEAV